MCSRLCLTCCVGAASRLAVAFLIEQLAPGLLLPWQRDLHRIVKHIPDGKHGRGLLLERQSDGKRVRMCVMTDRYVLFMRELTDAWIAGLTHCQRARIWSGYVGPDCRWCRAGLDQSTRVGDLHKLIMIPDQYVPGPAFDPVRNRILTDQEVEELLR